uniref:Uncharacterized protein n=1 Tax=Arundo donax TaxID=35708 RepID=A0A0A9DWY9_ARUDO
MFYLSSMQACVSIGMSIIGKRARRIIPGF